MPLTDLEGKVRNILCMIYLILICKKYYRKMHIAHYAKLSTEIGNNRKSNLILGGK
jgi:hypothetical protein